MHAPRYNASPIFLGFGQHRDAEFVISLCNSAHCEIGETRASPSSFLNKAFFLQTYKSPVADDDVIQNLDPDVVARLYQLFRRSDVLL